MSLINSILKDLDQRRQKGEANKRSFLTEVLLSAGKSKRIRIPRFIKFGIVMSLVAVVGVTGWGQYKDVIKSKYELYVNLLIQPESPPVQSNSQSELAQNTGSEMQPAMSTRSVDHQNAEKTEEKQEEIAVPEKMVLVDASKMVVQPKIRKELPLKRKAQRKIQRVVQTVQTTKPKPNKKKAGTVAKKTRPLSKGRKAELGIEKAMRMIRANNYKGAEKQLRRAIWLQSDNLKAREILAMLLINRGRISEAAKLLVDSLEIAPYHSPFAKLYARILVNQGETSSAIAILEQAQPDITSNPEYHSFLAALYQKQSMHERAIGKYQQVLSLRPNTGTWWLGLGISLEGLGRIDEALTAYKSARKSGNLNDNIIAYINSRINVLSES